MLRPGGPLRVHGLGGAGARRRVRHRRCARSRNSATRTCRCRRGRRSSASATRTERAGRSSATGFSDVEVAELPLMWRVASADAVFDAMSRGGVRTAAVLRAQTPDALARIGDAVRRGVEATRGTAASSSRCRRCSRLRRNGDPTDNAELAEHAEPTDSADSAGSRLRSTLPAASFGEARRSACGAKAAAFIVLIRSPPPREDARALTRRFAQRRAGRRCRRPAPARRRALPSGSAPRAARCGSAATSSGPYTVVRHTSAPSKCASHASCGARPEPRAHVRFRCGQRQFEPLAEAGPELLLEPAHREPASVRRFIDVVARLREIAVVGNIDQASAAS